jgi:hypothetical protein
MQDFVLVAIVFLLAVVFSKTSINPTLYQWIKWGIFIFTAITSLLILNIESIGRVAIQLANDLNQLGIGNPKSWEIKSRHFDGLISGCYYVTFFSTWFVLILSATYEHKNMHEVRKRDVLIDCGGVIIFGWIVYEIFWSSSPLNSGVFGKTLTLFYNSQIGVLTNQYIAINVLAFAIGLLIRAIFTRNNLEHESSRSKVG